MFVELSTAVLQAFVTVTVEHFIKRREASVPVAEIKQDVLALTALQGRAEQRLEVLEQLLCRLATQEPFDRTNAALEVRPTLSGITVESALSGFADSVATEIQQARTTGEEPTRNDPLAEALSGFHDELSAIRRQSLAGGNG